MVKILYGRFDGETCPYCGSKDTYYNEYHGDFHCHHCGRYFK